MRKTRFLREILTKNWVANVTHWQQVLEFITFSLFVDCVWSRSAKNNHISHYSLHHQISAVVYFTWLSPAWWVAKCETPPPPLTPPHPTHPFKPLPDSMRSVWNTLYSRGLNSITQLRVMYNMHARLSEDCFMLNDFKRPLWLPHNNEDRL